MSQRFPLSHQYAQKCSKNELDSLSILDSKSKSIHRPIQRETFMSAFMKRGLTSLGRNDSLVDKTMFLKLNLRDEFQCQTGADSSVFGIEFSKDGRMLLSSHKDHSLRGFDNRTHKLIWTKENAHLDCCNGCTFIDRFSFASYSDDKTAKVWDLRYMSQALKTLNGHTDWVKNVSVVPGGKKLLTSGFDSSLRMFDINCPSEELTSDPILELRDIYRTKLAPSGDFLLLTTWRTNVYKITNLDLETLKQDVDDFMANPLQRYPFRQDRNRIKFVHHLPSKEDDVYGYSIDISSDELCCVIGHSRLPHSEDEELYRSPEWISVYDLHQKGKPNDSESDIEAESDSTTDPTPTQKVQTELRQSAILEPEGIDSVSTDNHRESADTDTLESTRQIILAEERIELLNMMINTRLTRFTDDTRRRLNMLFQAWSYGNKCRPQDLNDVAFYYEFETSAPRIIKEAHFNRSGKLIICPSLSGFQIFSFDSELNSYSNSFGSNNSQVPNLATKLSVLKGCCVETDSSSSSCLCTKFSPVECMVAAGDEKGRVMWFMPVDCN